MLVRQNADFVLGGGLGHYVDYQNEHVFPVIMLTEEEGQGQNGHRVLVGIGLYKNDTKC
jgi:hypothetical protein